MKKVLMAASLLMLALSVTAQAQMDIPANPDATYRTADGKEVREYDVRVHRVGHNHISVEFSNNAIGTYRVPNDFRFDIDGNPTSLSGIVPRQRLKAYLTYDNDEWHLVHHSGDIVDDVVTVVTVAESAPEEDLVEVSSAPSMPTTASPLPMIALGGLALLGLSAGLRRRRLK